MRIIWRPLNPELATCTTRDFLNGFLPVSWLLFTSLPANLLDSTVLHTCLLLPSVPQVDHLVVLRYEDVDAPSHLFLPRRAIL